MNTALTQLYEYIGHQINGTPRQKSIFICWLSQPIYLLIGCGSAAGLLLSVWVEEVYNPLLWAGIGWGFFASIAWAMLGIYGTRHTMSGEQEIQFSQLTILLFGLSGVVSLLLVGPFNLVTGIVLTGCVLIGLLLFPARQITLVFGFSIAVILAYAILISLGGTLYRPLLSPVAEQPAQLWYNLMILLAATLIVIKDSFTVAALTDTWRHREARTLHQASTDPLTGVANRGHCSRILEQAFQTSAQTGSPLSVVLVDVDHFKQINDSYGHHTGDLALQLIAKSLGHALREKDLVGRHGGEEFLLILPGTDADNAIRVAERCAQALREIVIPGVHPLPDTQLSASFGVCSESAGPHTSPRQMIEDADRAMYQAKRSGRDRVILAMPTQPF